MSKHDEEALKGFALGIAQATARLFDDRLAAVERELAELLRIVIDEGDDATVRAVSQRLEESRPCSTRH